MTQTADSRATPIVTVRGIVGLGIGEYTESKITSVLAHAHGPVHQVRITVTRLPDPAVAEPVEASSHVNVDGAVLHTRAHADTVRTAVDRLAHRLARQLRTHSGRTHDHRSTAVHPSPVPGRTVLTHPSYSADRCSVEDAIDDLETLGYEFHLFTHRSGRDFLLRRATGGYLLSVAHGEFPEIAPHLPVLQGEAAPLLDTQQAQLRLDLNDEPSLFYVDTADGRGRLLYRRGDGGYGLVTPRA